MTTEISTFRPTETLPVAAKPVTMTASLAYYVAGDRVIGGDLHPIHGGPGRADISEARQKLTEAEHLCRPSSPRDIAIWCKKLESLPWAPATRELSQAAVVAICTACAELPAAVWTVETAATALRTWVRWPAPAQVYALLSEQARPFRESLEGLRRVAAGGTTSSPRDERDARTPEAIAHVSAIVGAFAAERSFTDPNHPQAAPAVKAAPLSDGALLAAYEKEAAGDGPFAQLSAARAVALRKRIEAEADFYS